MVQAVQFEVVYPLPHEQLIFKVSSEAPITIKDAIIHSEIMKKYTELNFDTMNVGVYADEKSLDFILDDDDRVEIYRPLTISPIDARRIRADKKRKDNLSTWKFGA